MRAVPGLILIAAAGLASCAKQEAADVFLFGRDVESLVRGARLPKEVARHILLQRTASSKYGHVVGSIPSTIDEITAMSYVNTYGKALPSLFDAPSSAPSQLVVILQGVTPENSKELREAIAKSPKHTSFAISNPPSTEATLRLMDDFRAAGTTTDTQCTFDLAVNPFDRECWPGTSSVVGYDAKKNSRVINEVSKNLDRLLSFVTSGDLEATIVLIPESSRVSAIHTWHSTSDSASDLKRRDFKEHVIVEDANDKIAEKRPVTVASSISNPTQNKGIPQCFTTESGCASQTNNCSGHGDCINKYGNNSKTICFVCSCKATVRDTGSKVLPQEIVEWGGAMCQKEDISAQFWLLTGFTITIIGAISFAIGLLFNMGQEKLPGVIGAGVSRSK